MNNNIDLTKILKDCPNGWKFYTPVWGEVTFIEIKKNKDCLYPICIYTNTSSSCTNLTKDGRYLINRIGTECILFPSKDQRDWSKFTAPWYKKESDTIALLEKQYEQEEHQVYETEDGKIITYSETDGYKFDEPNFHENEHAWLYLVSDVLTWKDGIGQYLDDPRVQELAKKLCSEYAQKLYNPSVLSNPSNTGKNKQKFYPNALQPFDKVLVRDSYEHKWRCALYSHTIEGENSSCRYVTENSTYEYCIPYNDDTKYLLGTRGEAPKFYRYWED